MDTLFIAPTFLCAATMIAALDANLVPRRGRLVLLVTNNSAAPEVSRGLDEQAGFESLKKRFDTVARLNDFISPYHPRSYIPQGEELHSLRARLRKELGLQGEVAIVAQSVHVRPSVTLFEIFNRGPVYVISDGLMSYGPTRIDLPRFLAGRLTRLLYLDLVRGLEPLLLDEFGLERRIVPDRFFRPVIRAYGEAAGYIAGGKDNDGLLLGQYLAALDILTAKEEEELHLDMVRVASALGLRRPAFKPHPSAPPVVTSRMESLAAELGMELDVLLDPLPVEVILEFTPARVIVGCFSTGLATAASIFSREVVTVGTEQVVRKLPLFEDSNRVPLALSHVTHKRALLEQGELRLVSPPPIDLQELVVQLGHAMQPRLHTAKRIRSKDPVTNHDPSLIAFFERPSILSTNDAEGPPRLIKKVPWGPKAWRAAQRAVRRCRRIYEQLTFYPH